MSTTKKSNNIRISDYIILKNHQLMVFNKPNGLAVQKTLDGSPNLSVMAMAYAKRDLYLINRIDQVVSGVVLFAKKKALATILNKQLKAREVKKVYYAIVENKPDFDEKQVSLFLEKDSARKKTIVVENGEQSYSLNLKLIASSDNYHLLKITPIGGFFHQIRAILSHIGHPIKGDVKYGARRKNSDRSIHLHAYSYSFHVGDPDNKHTISAPFPKGDALWDYFSSTLQEE